MTGTAYSDERRVIARVIREARERSGLHQNLLAERIGKTQSYISKIEGSHQGVDVLVLMEIARALEIDAVQLFNQIFIEISDLRGSR